MLYSLLVSTGAIIKLGRVLGVGASGGWGGGGGGGGGLG